MEDKTRESLVGKACRRFKNLRLSLALSWWRHVVAETARVESAQASAMKIMQRALRRWVLESLGPCFEWWLHIIEEEKRIEAAQTSAMKLMQRALTRWTRDCLAPRFKLPLCRPPSSSEKNTHKR